MKFFKSQFALLLIFVATLTFPSQIFAVHLTEAQVSHHISRHQYQTILNSLRDGSRVYLTAAHLAPLRTNLDMLEDAPDGDVRVTEAADALLDILHDRLGTYDDGYEADSDDDAAQAVPDFNSLVEFPPLPAATGLAPAIELGAWANPCAL